MAHPDGDASPGAELTFDQELAAVERSLHDLKQRYSQVQQDQATQADLQARQETLKQQGRRQPSTAMKQELKQIEQQLDDLDWKLESQLFSLKDAFWQVVRFAGLGVVLGWGLAFAVLQSPPPKDAIAPDAPTLTSPPTP